MASREQGGLPTAIDWARSPPAISFFSCDLKVTSRRQTQFTRHQVRQSCPLTSPITPRAAATTGQPKLEATKQPMQQHRGKCSACHLPQCRQPEGRKDLSICFTAARMTLRGSILKWTRRVSARPTWAQRHRTGLHAKPAIRKPWSLVTPSVGNEMPRLSSKPISLGERHGMER